MRTPRPLYVRPRALGLHQAQLPHALALGTEASSRKTRCFGQGLRHCHDQEVLGPLSSSRFAPAQLFVRSPAPSTSYYPLGTVQLPAVPPLAVLREQLRSFEDQQCSASSGLPRLALPPDRALLPDPLVAIVLHHTVAQLFLHPERLGAHNLSMNRTPFKPVATSSQHRIYGFCFKSYIWKGHGAITTKLHLFGTTTPWLRQSFCAHQKLALKGYCVLAFANACMQLRWLLWSHIRLMREQNKELHSCIFT